MRNPLLSCEIKSFFHMINLSKLIHSQGQSQRPSGFSLNNYQIKLLAALLMVVDHVGLIFFPSTTLWRLVGRISFPLFAWLLAQGAKHTRSFSRYLLRLLILGLLSQPIYYFAFSSNQLNILFTLAIGLITLRLENRFHRYRYLIRMIGVVLAELLNVDYGGYGVLVILLLGSFRSTLIWWVAWIALHIAVSSYLGFNQTAAVITPVILGFANHRRGPKARWFYGFYPFHLLALKLVSYLFS